ncbi:MAG: sarcosine oxidase subunit gamma, partial [Paracoccaceae bacterium]
MSDPVSALSGARYDGFAAVREIGPLGMITLRAKAGTPGLEAAVLAATGCALPATRRIVRQGARAAGWMS